MNSKSYRLRVVLAAFLVLLAAGLLLWVRGTMRLADGASHPANAPSAANGREVQPAGNAPATAQGSASGNPVPAAATVTSGNSVVTGDNGQLSAGVLRQIDALEKAKRLRTPVQDKIDSQLLYADKMRRGEPIAAGVPTQRVDLDSDANGRVLVDITATVTTELLNYITTAGGNIINNFPQYQAIRAAVPLALMETIAARAEVKFVKPAVRVMSNNIDSEGDVTHQATVARATFGVDGAGIKVGVLSDSVDHLTNSQIAGLVTVLAGQSGMPAAGEGTAMLEIVNDLAPGAQLFFATAGASEASFASNIQQLRSAGCDIIVDDELYFDESPFQDGIIAQAVNTVTASGALYFSSAANSGNQDSGTSGTWEGDFADGGAALLEAGRIHAFAAGTNYDTVLPGGSFLRADLFWADPQGASTNDYDIAILNSAGTSVVASSTTRQNGAQNPYESVNSLLSGERIVIIQFSGTNRFLHLSTGRGLLSISTAGSTRGHACATNAFCVAAVAATNTYPGAFTGGASDPVDTFSSDGPRHVFFQADGTPFTPGNFTSSGGTVRQKPELAAADGVTTDVTGFAPFYGTSAAAPHAAAIAALLKSYNPALTPSQVRTFLTSTNLDIMSPGVDQDSGYGIVMAPATLRAAPPEPLRLTPGSGFNSVGYVDGPFTATSRAFTLTNIGSAPFTWSLANTSAWLTASSSGGTLTPGGPAASVVVSLNTTASNLPPGSYSATVNFTNLASGIVRSRAFSLAVNEPLQIGPAAGFDAVGNAHGPFSVTSQTYSLTNAGGRTLSWAVTNMPTWLNVSSSGGTLPAGSSTQVTVSLNTTASNLPPSASVYASTLIFTNLTGASAQGRAFTLTIYQWTPVSAPVAAWQSIASSADGTRWAAAAFNGGVYVFTNSGAGWFQTPASNGFWASVAGSSDLGKMVAAISGGFLYTSGDGGQTWVTNNTPPENWVGVAASADGSRLFAGANFDLASHPGVMYGSTNAGGTWSVISPANSFWAHIASSADGSKLASAVISGSIWTSTNGGTGWTVSDAPIKSWSSIASSADGTRVVAAANGSLIYTSTNSGAHWMTNGLRAGNWGGVASSADGLKLAAVAFGVICTSADGGITWSTNSAPNHSWNAVASSTDGASLVAAAGDGTIYVSRTQAVSLPQLGISRAANQFVLAWPTNATGFVLQQNLDLTTTNWTAVTNVVNQSGAQNQVFITPQSARDYFRLSHP